MPSTITTHGVTRSWSTFQDDLRRHRSRRSLRVAFHRELSGHGGDELKAMLEDRSARVG